MDWEAVARLLAARGAPAILIDRDLKVALFDERVARLLHLADDDSAAPRPLLRLAALALEGAAAGAECRIDTASGTRVDLAIEQARVGEGAEACALLLVRAAFEHITEPGSAAHDAPLEYEITPGLTPFGRLLRVVTDARVEHYWSGDVPRCHERIHGSVTPCNDCPVLRPGLAPSVAVRAARQGEQAQEVVCVETRARTIVVHVHRLRCDEVEKLRASRLQSAIEAADLSAEERAVVEHLVNGDSSDAIAAARGVSHARVRRCEEAILRKLGPRSRVDLLLRFL